MSFLGDIFNMFQSKDAHESVYGGGNFGGNYEGYQGGPPPQHHSSWTHELVGGAAGFAAMKAYEDHCRRTGEQVSHPLMKEMLAGFAAAEVDKLFETKGLDFLDREKAKHRAIQQAHYLAEQQYGQGGVYSGQPSPYGNYPNNFQQPGNYGMNQFNNMNYPQQGGYGMNPYNNGNNPQQGGYGMNPYNNGNNPQQGGYGMNPYNYGNYQ